jgi:hypothetical protein
MLRGVDTDAAAPIVMGIAALHPSYEGRRIS